MIFNHNFLYALTGVLSVALLCDDVCAANWQAAQPLAISRDEDIQKTLGKTRDSTRTAGIRKQLCPAGQYVSKCGNYDVGFYWLKPAKLPYQNDDTLDPNEEGVRETIDTRDYYVGETNYDLFRQMRGFFSGNDTTTILYKDADTGIQPIPYATFVEDRELILKNVCHPALTSISCTVCPDEAHVEESSVELDEDNLAIPHSWVFHTIADCYAQEFTDSTGTYFFVPANAPDISIVELDQSEHCFYTPDASSESLNGDEIGTVVPGTSVSLKKQINGLTTSSKGKLSVSFD